VDNKAIKLSSDPIFLDRHLITPPVLFLSLNLFINAKPIVNQERSRVILSAQIVYYILLMVYYSGFRNFQKVTFNISIRKVPG
jgi:hypothetical protein